MKKDSEKIKEMFNSIAPKYDFLNHFLSMGVDKGWRRKVVKRVRKRAPLQLLDLATGTGDLAIAIAKKNPACRIIGGDLSANMLAVGREKVQRLRLEDQISLVECNAMQLPFADGAYDVVTAAFGVRNFEHLERGLSEIYRVTRRGGKVFILEFSKPKRGVVSALYLFYFRNILPLIGRMVSKDDRAYSYLPDSVLEFPCGDDFIKILSGVGFCNCRATTLSFGIATIYEGEKVEI